MVAAWKVVMFLDIYRSRCGAVVSVKKYNPVSPFQSFMTPGNLDQAEAGTQIRARCLRQGALKGPASAPKAGRDALIVAFR